MLLLVEPSDHFQSRLMNAMSHHLISLKKCFHLKVDSLSKNKYFERHKAHVLSALNTAQYTRFKGYPFTPIILQSSFQLLLSFSEFLM